MRLLVRHGSSLKYIVLHKMCSNHVDHCTGLRVKTNHLDTLKRKFVIGRITKPANQASFSCDGKEVTVAQYMKEKYGITLR